MLMIRNELGNFCTTPVIWRSVQSCCAKRTSQPPQACKLLSCVAALTCEIEQLELAELCQFLASARIKHSCSSLPGPYIFPAGLHRSSSKSNTASFGGSARVATAGVSASKWQRTVLSQCELAAPAQFGLVPSQEAYVGSGEGWASLVVVAGCTAAFMIGAILAYHPSRGSSRRGPAGGET
jgi:hypothetical protein